MDIKVSKSRNSSKKTAGHKSSRPSYSPSLGVNRMVLKTSWTQTSVSSGTTGTMSSWTSPSIIHSSEYSVVSSLFSEVKLQRAKFIFTPVQSANGSVNHCALVVSTNMLLNENTGADPTSYTDVQNQVQPVRISTLDVKPLIYSMVIPGGLEYANIAADAPNPPTPWAGSPGIIRWYATGGTPSTVYFQLHVEVVYTLRGRQ